MMAKINGFNYDMHPDDDGGLVAKRVLTIFARPNPDAHVVTPQVDKNGKPTGKRVEWIFLVPVAMLLLLVACVFLVQVPVLPV